ncbi:hypothetical protein GF406_23245 [candidate division KSB1 bacterium]|nr:hypothetical protein [candidate division KSB1 bacterium]
MKPDSKLDVEVGYIGGGNALLIFRHGRSIAAQDFVKKWSREVLLQFPGIVPAAVIREFKPTDTQVNADNLNKLFRELSITKNQMVPITELPRYGITTDCVQSGLSAEVFDSDINVQKWVSSVSKAKINNAAKKINNDFESPDEKDVLDSIAGKSYRFTHTEEKMGQLESQNHIAVVHIDGNSMGHQFQECENLSERKKLSLAVENRTREAWEFMIESLMKNIVDLEKDGIINPMKSEDKKYDLLPVRKLILNGDDLTFVCNAQLAFWLTEIFLEKLTRSALTFQNADMMNSENKPIYISACAGIAIVKTKFPFYRAYELAEDLCRNAKEIGREKKESWFDFEIVYGGVSGGLKNIRKKKYPRGQETLRRPWRLFNKFGKKGTGTNSDWSSLKNALKEFNRKNNGRPIWPRSKQKELLQMITRGEQSFQDYAGILLAGGTKLPNLPVDNEKTKIQFFYDSLQAIEFYSNFLLEGGNSHA